MRPKQDNQKQQHNIHARKQTGISFDSYCRTRSKWLLLYCGPLSIIISSRAEGWRMHYLLKGEGDNDWMSGKLHMD